MYWAVLLRSLQVESKQGNKNEIKKGMLHMALLNLVLLDSTTLYHGSA